MKLKINYQFIGMLFGMIILGIPLLYLSYKSRNITDSGGWLIPMNSDLLVAEYKLALESPIAIAVSIIFILSIIFWRWKIKKFKIKK